MGLTLGSFLNSCAYRLPRKISLVTVRSFCPNCGHGINWVALIPVVGFLLQRGRCDECGVRIPLRYPAGELFFMSMIVVLFLRDGLTIDLAFGITFAFLMTLIAVIDFKHFIIPNELVLTSAGAGIMYVLIDPAIQIDQAILTSLGSLLLLFAIRAVGNAILKKESMGLGDVKLAGVIGLFVGFVPFLLALWGASMAGAVYGLVQASTQPPRQKTGGQAIPLLLEREGGVRGMSLLKVPFGSFLAISSLFVFIFESDIMLFIEKWLNLNQ